jgi:UDP-glucose 4-epimerase
MGERLIEDYGNAYGLRYVIMRLFNPAGADALGILGETPDRVSHVVATLVKAAMGIVSVFPLYGTDYSTPDGTSIRDYVHVTDVAAAHRCALRHLEAGKDSTIVNIGSGKGISLKHLVAKVEERCARSIRVEYRPQRNIYQPYLVADIAKAMDILGWRPCHSSLDNIIDSTFRWLTNAIEEEKTVPNALHSL